MDVFNEFSVSRVVRASITYTIVPCVQDVYAWTS